MRKPVVAILAQGAMGAGIAARPSAHGVRVLTCREGRSAAGALRASLTASQPALSARCAPMVPSMCGKAYRRAGEVAELAAFAQGIRPPAPSAAGRRPSMRAFLDGAAAR